MRTLASSRDLTTVVARLANLRIDSTRRWGRMSPPQAVCHLIDSTLVALGELAVSRVDTPLHLRQFGV